MKNPIIKNGLYAALFLVVVSFIFYLALGTDRPENFKLGETLGYISIILALVFVFFGIKQYRDNENGGNISFWKAIGVGSLISLFPSFAFGLYNYVYTEFLDPEFSEKYFSYSLEQAKANMAVEEFEAYKTMLESQMAMFENPFLGSFIMFITVFIIGFIVSFISAFILKKAKGF